MSEARRRYEEEENMGDEEVLTKVVSKKRRPMDSPEITKEIVFYCQTEEELLKLLEGYRQPTGNWTKVSANDLLEEFDPCRPHRSVKLVNAAGDTDSISLHTLH